MNEMLFDIVFKGRHTKNIEKDKAVMNFAKIFKQDLAKAELFFDGKPRTLKKSLPMEKANHIRSVLKKAGLRVSLQKLQSNETEQTVAENQKSNSTTQDQNKDGSWELNEPGTVLIQKPCVSPVHVDTSSLSLSEVGVQFAEKPTVEVPVFELDSMVLDEVGAQMAKKQRIESPEFDVSHLEANEVTGNLEQKKEIQAPQFDFENLEIDDAGAQIVSKEKIPEPQFDLSGIELAE